MVPDGALLKSAEQVGPELGELRDVVGDHRSDGRLGAVAGLDLGLDAMVRRPILVSFKEINSSLSFNTRNERVTSFRLGLGVPWHAEGVLDDVLLARG